MKMGDGKCKIIWVVSVVFATLLFSCGGRSNAVSAAGTVTGGTVFEVSDSIITAGVADTLRFGRMREGEMVEKEFRIKNTDDEPLVIINVDSSCGCTLFGFSREPVMPGQEKIVTASFDSAGYHGETVKKASIYTSLSPKPHTIIVEALVN